MSARNRAIKRDALARQDALDLLAQGRRTGGMPGGQLTRRGGDLVDVVGGDTRLSVGNMLTCPTWGSDVSKADPKELAALASVVRETCKGSESSPARRWPWRPRGHYRPPISKMPPPTAAD